jgi:hypothetical protein
LSIVSSLLFSSLLVFSGVSRNWAGESLDFYQRIINYARTISTQTGFIVAAYLRRHHYPADSPPRLDAS